MEIKWKKLTASARMSLEVLGTLAPFLESLEDFFSTDFSDLPIVNCGKREVGEMRVREEDRFFNSPPKLFFSLRLPNLAAI